MASSGPRPLRVGLLGAGAMGAEHAYCYSQMTSVEVVGVFSRDPARAAETAGPLGAKVFSDASELIDDPQVDAIDVCLPTPVHARYVLPALGAGKHVFCETPLTLDRREGDRMRQAARAAGKLLQVGLLMRSIGAGRLVRSFVDTGEHGRLLSVTAYRLGSYLRPGADLRNREIVRASPALDQQEVAPLGLGRGHRPDHHLATVEAVVEDLVAALAERSDRGIRVQGAHALRLLTPRPRPICLAKAERRAA